MELYAFQLLWQVVKILFTVDMPVNAAVSYTHLTLPTILRV